MLRSMQSALIILLGIIKIIYAGLWFLRDTQMHNLNNKSRSNWVSEAVSMQAITQIV